MLGLPFGVNLFAWVVFRGQPAFMPRLSSAPGWFSPACLSVLVANFFGRVLSCTETGQIIDAFCDKDTSSDAFDDKDAHCEVETWRRLARQNLTWGNASKVAVCV